MLGPLGGPEIAIIAVVIILIFGVGKFSSLGRDLGTSIKEFRRAVKDEDADPAKNVQQASTPPPPPAQQQYTPPAPPQAQPPSMAGRIVVIAMFVVGIAMGAVTVWYWTTQVKVADTTQSDKTPGEVSPRPAP
jgi:sec-independent protein translocase protein TatA